MLTQRSIVIARAAFLPFSLSPLSSPLSSSAAFSSSFSSNDWREFLHLFPLFSSRGRRKEKKNIPRNEDEDHARRGVSMKNYLCWQVQKHWKTMTRERNEEETLRRRSTPRLGSAAGEKTKKKEKEKRRKKCIETKTRSNGQFISIDRSCSCDPTDRSYLSVCMLRHIRSYRIYLFILCTSDKVFKQTNRGH